MYKYKLALISVLCILLCGITAYSKETSGKVPETIEPVYLETGVESSLNITGEKTTEQTPPKHRSEFLDLFKNGYVFEGGIVKSVKLGASYDGVMNWTETDGDLLSTYRMPTVHAYIDTKFRDDKTEFKFQYNFNREIEGHPNEFTEGISDIYLTRHINKNQKIIIGQGPRVPIGIEGTLSPQNLDMVQRAQIGKKFSNTRSVGIRNVAKYKYIDYDIGFFDATRYMEDFGQGTELVGWVNFKPLANLNADKYGQLKIGAGYDVGDYKHSYSVVGSYLGYDYKKLHAKVEYASANGYNSSSNVGTKAEGYYTTIAYDLTKKFQLVARYDYLNSNKSKNNADSTEYSAGVTYNLNKYVKILANYMYKVNANNPNQNIFLLGFRFAT